MLRRVVVTLLLAAVGGGAAADPRAADPRAADPRAAEPRDVREPPFSEFDFTWLEGNNSQPPSLLTMGPLTWSLYVDAYYAYQFHAPIDHTIFPGVVANRHNEVSLNLAVLGVEVTGLDGPIGRLYVQYGSNMDASYGQDPTVARGYFLSSSAFKYIEQAAVGWHFHALHGINLELGIFPSYVGLESYLPQENWSYTHSFVSDFTPFYFFGLRAQLFATRRLKIELWLVNGWQTFGEWHEGRSGGYAINWRPRGWLSLIHSLYLGQEVLGDPSSLRAWTDNSAQLRYWQRRGGGRGLQSAALALVADVGLEHRGAPTPDGWEGGISLANRLVWARWLATTVRGDLYYDQRGTLVQPLPLGDPYTLPAGRSYLLGGLAATVDVAPSPWVLFRLEYSHRESSQPYFSGHGGITGPSGLQGPAIPTFTPDLQRRDDRLILNATLRL